MRKLLVLLLVGIFFFSFASALEINNVKIYDSQNKKAILKESQLGDEIATVTLQTPQVFYVGLGYQKVFQFEIDSKKAYTDFLQELEVYDFYGMKKTNRQIDLKYQTFYLKNVTDYEMICQDTDNLTYFNNCNEVVKGYHMEVSEMWNDLTKKDLIKGQKLVISGWTWIEKDETKEWIPTFAGKKVPEWAVWKNYLNTNLSIYYSMNETSPPDLTNAIGNNNGKIYNNGTMGHAGIWGTSIYFNETTKANSTLALNISGNMNRTYGAWVKLNSTTDEYIVVTGGSGGGLGGVMKVASGNLCFDKFGASGCSNGSVSVNQWTHLAITWNGSLIQFYINGTNRGTYNPTSLNTANNAVTIGTAFGDFAYTDGLIDEVMVWNRSLNSTEINDSMFASYWSVESTMTINITLPQNTTYTSTSRQLNVTNTSGNASTWYYNLNGAGNTTFTPNTTITASQGLNTLIVYANDSLGSWSTDTEYFFVDSLAPNLTIITPENGQVYADRNQSLNLSVNDTNGVNLTWYNWNSSTNYTYELVNTVNLPTSESWLMEANKGDGFSNNTPTRNASHLNLTITHEHLGNSNVDIYGEYLFFTDGDGTTGSNFYKYWSNGTQIWNKSLGAIYAFGGVTICNDTSNNTWAFVGDQNGVGHQFNATDGNRYAWFDSGANQISKPATCGFGTVAFPTHNNAVFVRNITNINTSIGIADVGSPVLSTPCFSDDGTYFYFGSNDFKLHQRTVSNPNASDSASYTAGAEVWKTLTCEYQRVAIGTNTQNKVFIFNQTDITSPLCSATVGGGLHSPPAFDSNGIRWFVGTQGGTISAGYIQNCSVYQNISVGGEVTEKVVISNDSIYFPVKNVDRLVSLNKTNLSQTRSNYSIGAECLGMSFGNGFVYANCFDEKVYKFGNGTDYFLTTPPIINFSIGVNNLNVWSNDTYGNLAYSSSTFTISATAPYIDLQSPANGITTASQNITLIGNVTSDFPIVNVSFLINATVVSTNTSGINNSNYSYTTSNLYPANYNWSMRACNNESVCRTTSNRTFNILIPAPTVELLSPADNTFTNNTSVVLVANVTSSNTLNNVSFYINGTIFNTNSSGINNSNYSYSTTLSDRNYNWSVRACNDINNCTTSSNRTFTIDTSAPVINVTFPSGIYNTANATNTTFINITITDSNTTSSCFYSYNGGANTSYTCGTNLTKSITFASQNISVYANDSYGNLGVKFANWSYKAYTQSETYDATVSEGGSTTFIYNFSTNQVSPSTVYLNYSGTLYTANITQDNYNYSVYTTINVPTVDSTTNYSFFWNITRTDGFSFGTTAKNQTITPFSLDNCSVNGIYLFNFTMVDEDSQLRLNNNTDNTSMNTEFLVINPNDGQVISNLSQISTWNPFLICMNSSIGSTNYTINSTVQYSSNNRFTEFYNIRNFTLSNTTLYQNITLYDLNSSRGTQFKVTYKDSGFQTVPGALIQVQRKYLSEATYKTIELPQVGSNGYAIANFVEETELYRLIIIRDGVVEATFDNIVAYCPNPIYSECQININSYGSSTDIEDYSVDTDFQSTLTLNKTSRVVSASFTIPSGVASNVSLQGILFNGYSNTSVCSDTAISTSGLLTCAIPSTYENASIFLKLLKDNTTKKSVVTSLGQTPQDQFEGNLIFLGLTFMLFLIGIGVQDDPKTMVPTLVLGVIVMTGINLFTTASWIGTGATILWFIVGLIIVMMKGANR